MRKTIEPNKRLPILTDICNSTRTTSHQQGLPPYDFKPQQQCNPTQNNRNITTPFKY